MHYNKDFGYVRLIGGLSCEDYGDLWHDTED